MPLFPSKSIALALVLAAPAAQAQQFAPGVDPQLVMMMEQLISSAYMTCQMGDQWSCQNAQAMQQYASQIIGAGQYCMQTNDMNACGFYQQGAMAVQQSYMQMAQMAGGQTGMTQGYDPNNPLGATHNDRMAAIAGFGAQNTQNWQNQQLQNDANHNAFIDYIRQ